MERKLAAIFSTDVKGYSRLMGDDEEATIRTIKVYREVISGLIEQHHGRVVDSPGDNMLAEFASAVDAVQASVAIQKELAKRNAELEAHRKMEFRIGLNVGDVITDEGRLYGDGVNIAARLEGLAEPGGICISGNVHEQVRNKLALACEYIGEREVKNIATPVSVYKVQLESDGRATPGTSPQSSAPSRVQETRPLGRWSRAALAVVAVLLVGAGLLVYRPVSPPFSPRLPLPDKPSIAVLPFTNMSSAPEQEYFSDGLTDDIITDLSQISGLFVIARNSTFAYKGQAVKVKEVGREFGVRYVLEGSTRKAADRVRVTAQLIETATSHHLWAKNYDRPLSDIFAVQDDIVQQIGAALRVEVLEAEQERVRRIPTENLNAYDAVLRGQEQYLRQTKEGILQARPLFEQAIALDSQYADAYAWLGFSYINEWGWWNQDPQLLERAGELAQQALALDDSLPHAHMLLGYVYQQDKQHEQAIAEAERSLALDPNNADAYYVLAEILTFARRPEEALGLVQQAMRLNPRVPAWYTWVLGMAYNDTGQYAKAIAAYKDTLRRNPNMGMAYGSLAVSYWQQWDGQWSHDPQTLDYQLEAAQHAVALSESHFWFHGLLGQGYLRQKRYAEALTAAERAVTLAPHEPLSQAYLGNVLNFTGRAEDAITRLEQVSCATALVGGAAFCFLVQGDAYALTGRYAEAITAYQHVLRHHPSRSGSDRLFAHFGLAASYSELGQAEEARAEVAEVLQTNPNFSLEVWQQRVPFQDPVVTERIASALRQAGLE